MQASKVPRAPRGDGKRPAAAMQKAGGSGFRVWVWGFVQDFRFAVRDVAISGLFKVLNLDETKKGNPG